jgi:hypothetical protein
MTYSTTPQVWSGYRPGMPPSESVYFAETRCCEGISQRLFLSCQLCDQSVADSYVPPNYVNDSADLVLSRFQA